MNRDIKVVHISTTDYGGAFRATQRIHESLLACGIHSKILVRTKIHNSATVEELDCPIKKLVLKLGNLFNFIASHGNVISSDYFGTSLLKEEMVQEADIVILHAVNAFLSYKGIEKLFDKKNQIIWVMHEMSCFTGGCYYDYECNKYLSECGKCFLLKSKKEKDITRRQIRRKKKLVDRCNILFVSPSRWLAGCAKKSLVLKNREIEILPNPINCKVFRPMEQREYLKKRYGIANKKKVILFGATNSITNPLKGFDYLKKALKYLNVEEYFLLIYGNRNDEIDFGSEFEYKTMGIIDDDRKLCEIYNLADVFVAPSLQDNYPGTVLEALACGIPVVAFRTGGMPDLVIHKENGYLADLRNTEELALGIEYCSLRSSRLGQCARKRIVLQNSYENIGNRYLNMVSNMIEGNSI